jgi:hypothetical protein
MVLTAEPSCRCMHLRDSNISSPRQYAGLNTLNEVHVPATAAAIFSIVPTRHHARLVLQIHFVRQQHH